MSDIMHSSGNIWMYCHLMHEIYFSSREPKCPSYHKQWEMASKQAAKMHGRLIQGKESMATNSGEEGRWTFSFWGFHLGWSDWEKEAVTTKDQWLLMRHRSRHQITPLTFHQWTSCYLVAHMLLSFPCLSNCFIWRQNFSARFQTLLQTFLCPRAQLHGEKEDANGIDDYQNRQSPKDCDNECSLTNK